MFDAEKLAKLSPEQLVIAKLWEKERLERLSCLDRMDAARASNDTDAFYQAYKEYKSLTKDRCEHGRSVWYSCYECCEIQNILNPDD